MNEKIKKTLSTLLIIGSLVTSSANVFATEVNSPVIVPPVVVTSSETAPVVAAPITRLKSAQRWIGLIVGSDVRLRREPGLNGTVIDLLGYNTTIYSYKESKNVDNHSWTKVTLTNGITGWVESKFASLANYA
ncbi:SH3 domain-containing protein [Clostridium tagluense]|uniref:SH3 domain-containing protein n=1 Tax=Clostridium tagluense TaxID=360422 RepID=UPI001C0C3AAA|nr:SH3 domain-containing protein [Clostridium tagluense]MBU3130776.1 SH3 domain-containing protein [Clostridium tagluense]